jgi:hypothetical protein
MQQRHIRAYFIATATIWGLYALAMFFPEQLWTFHHVKSMNVGPLLLGVSLVLVLLPWWLDSKRPSLAISSIESLMAKPLTALGIAILAGVLFHSFPLALDLYGDARYIWADMAPEALPWDSQLLKDLLFFDLRDPKIGMYTCYSISNFLSSVLGVSGEKAWHILQVVLGMSYVFVWIRFVNRVLHQHPLRLVWMLAGISAPLCFHFAGHTEIYTPTFFLHVLFFYCWWSCLHITGAKEKVHLLIP